MPYLPLTMSRTQTLPTRDTIAAVATPPGQGGLAVIRVSGPRALDVAEAVFRASGGGDGLEPRRLHHGHVLDAEGRRLDEVLAAYMPEPHSYTGEDVVEISCHGGRAVTRAVLEAVLAAGARLAERGEFTRRAFLNGRLDLTQAEAVAELIHAPTRAALHLAQTKLSGLLGSRVADLASRLEILRQQFCLAVDFPEDEVECLPPEELNAVLDAALADLDSLLAGVGRARAWREGALVVLAGRVNAGKSSLLNALLGRTRALVAEQPGTTRDYIEEPVDLDGLVIRLADTAGLRETPGDGHGEVERAGMDMGRELAARADLVLLVHDATQLVDRETLDAAASYGQKRCLALANKADLVPGEAALDHFRDAGFEALPVSARTGQGLDRLCARIRERILDATGAGSGEPDPDEVAPNTRQAAHLARAREELDGLRADATRGMPPDVLSVRLDLACAQLREITGTLTPEAVLDAIFENFCIGK